MDTPQGTYYWPQATPGRRGLLPAAAAVTQATLADTEDPLDSRWVNGFSFLSDSCGAVDPMTIRCFGSPLDKTPVENPDAVNVAPFLTFGSDKCSALDNARPRAARARRNLIATESWQIEREFFDGVASKSDTEATFQNPYMTDGVTATDIGGTDLSPLLALAALEAELMSCLHGQRTMIHASPELVTIWNNGGALHLEGNTLLTTACDSIVIPGAGYSGNDPDGDAPAAGRSWAYGTGIVYILQDSIDDPSSGQPASRVDKAHNTITYLIERVNALLFSPCCVLAVEADLTK